MVSAGPFALFDDGSIASNRSAGGAGGSAATDFTASSTPGSSGGSSRLYTGFVREHVCHDPVQLDAFDTAVAADLAAGLHAVVLADYEWGTALNGVPGVSGASGASRRRVAGLPGEPQQVRGALDASPPALRCLMFDTLARPTRGEVDDWLVAHDNRQAEPSCAGVLDLEPSVDRAEFDRSMSEIGEALRAGDAYQINYTFRLDFTAYGEPLALYRPLARASAGTVRRFDRITRAALDPIVLTGIVRGLRWRFGRIDSAANERHRRTFKRSASRSRRGVGVGPGCQESRRKSDDRRFAAQRFGPYRRDRLGENTGAFFDRGAPQRLANDLHGYGTPQGRHFVRQRDARVVSLWVDHRCAQASRDADHRIARIDAARALYRRDRLVGRAASGYAQRMRGFLLVGCDSYAVPASAPCHDRRAGRLGIGAGIVLDSRCDDEYEECYLKARFLTGLDPGLTLFETIRASRGQGAPYLDRHLARLASGARRLGFACEPAALRAAVLSQIAELPTQLPAQLADAAEYRLRLVLAHDGRASITHAPLRPLPPGPVKIWLAQDLGFAATEACDALLRF